MPVDLTYPAIPHSAGLDRSGGGVAWNKHASMHGDLDGNGVIDTSVTWTGQNRSQLPTPLEYDGLLWFT